MRFSNFFKYTIFFLLFSFLMIGFIPAQAANGEGDIQPATPTTPLITEQPRAEPNLRTESTNLTRSMNVLQLDGGGVRGAFSAQILRGMSDQAQLPIHEIFKGGITGTSTGSIIALALTCPQHRNVNDEWQDGPYTPQEIVDFYSHMADDVFKCWTPQNCWSNLSSGYQEGFMSSLVKTLTNILTCGGCGACCKNCDGFCGPRYSNHALRGHLDHMFGEMTLKQSLVPVQAVAYDIRLGSPQYFTTYDTPGMRLADAALCSSAAPTFFPGVSVPLGDGSNVQCVDGGLIDNSAAFAALSLAKNHYARTFQGTPPAHLDDFILCSVGTGEPTPQNLYKNLKHAGKLGWAGAAVEIGISGRSQATEQVLQAIYSVRNDEENAAPKKYFRIQTNLTRIESEMDNPAIIQGLISKASALTRSPGGNSYNDFMTTHFNHPPIREEHQLAQALLLRTEEEEEEGQVSRLAAASSVDNQPFHETSVI